MEFAFHPAAEIFPLMSDREFDELVESIRTKGQQEPIRLYHGKIIDGRNRYRACKKLGKKPDVLAVDLGNLSPAQYVIAMNLERRHLSESQRAWVGGKLKEYHAKEAKERQQAAGGNTRSPIEELAERFSPNRAATAKESQKSSSRLPSIGGKREEQKSVSHPSPIDGKRPRQPTAAEQAAKAVNVSPRSVERAAKAQKTASAALSRAVESGQVKVSVAAKLAELPKAEQTAAVKAGPAAVKQAAKKVQPKPKPSAKPRKSFVASNFYDTLKRTSAHFAEIDARYGGIAKLLDHDDWDDAHTHRVSELVYGLMLKFQETDKEMQGHAKTNKK